ncbi:DUF3048 domain-containing protein [Paenibacillus sp. SC116]|uniref:DUF3048 domain-containing protein n=1 Tax=Paenibacillus sp. SC116 TaxID=2968986 RepID=UPI00215AFEFD|nr:DUF3048 domain-containing protein [Paenibacillus sp. SC116]
MAAPAPLSYLSSFIQRKRGLLLALFCFSLLLTACNSKPTAEETTPVVPPQVVDPIQTSEEPQEEAVLAPLTGLAWEAGEPTKRPIAVMINNQKRARPQSGLQQADILVEVLAEGGITRLVAIYHSDSSYTGEIGPIRSIRPYLIDIGESFGAALIHAGGSPDGYRILQRQNKDYLDEISNAGPYFWRDKQRRAPHNLYTNVDKIAQGMMKKKYEMTADVPAFSFMKGNGADNTNAAMNGEPAKHLRVAFSNHSELVEYQYEEQSGHYIRYMAGEPHTDKISGEPLKTANIIVMYAKHRVLDDVGRLEVDVRAGGRAVIVRDGQAVNGEWLRSNEAFEFKVDGRTADLKPGTTHMLIISDDKTSKERAVWNAQ